MEERRRLTLEEMNERHPDLIPALRNHPDVGWLLVRSSEHGPLALGAAGTHHLAEGRVEGEDPLAGFSPNAAQHLRRTDGFIHVADIMIGSFYDPALETGCAFEELISFHGGIGGPQYELLGYTRTPPRLCRGGGRSRSCHPRVGRTSRARRPRKHGIPRARSRPVRVRQLRDAALSRALLSLLDSRRLRPSSARQTPARRTRGSASRLLGQPCQRRAAARLPQLEASPALGAGEVERDCLGFGHDRILPRGPLVAQTSAIGLVE